MRRTELQLLLLVLITNFGYLGARYNRTVITERDMTREEALEWRKKQHSYVRVCGRHGTYGTDARKCPKGVVIKEPYTPDCICLRGVWVLHRTLCDLAPVILIGRRNHPSDCYTVEFPITTLLLLGNVEIPFETRAYVAPHTLTVFQEIPQNGNWTSTLEFKYPVILVINPKGASQRSYEAEDPYECFTTTEVNAQPQNRETVHIWKTALPYTRYRQVKTCSDTSHTGYEEIATHDYFYYHATTVNTLPIESCYEPCTIWPEGNKPYLMSSKEESDSRVIKQTYTKWLALFRNEELGDSGLEGLAANEESESKEDDDLSITAAKRRKKRKIVDCETVWEGKGFCMRSYWDPLDKFEMPQEHQSLCYPSNKGAPRKKLRHFG